LIVAEAPVAAPFSRKQESRRPDFFGSGRAILALI
jgi:hypothetical protein